MNWLEAFMYYGVYYTALQVIAAVLVFGTLSYGFHLFVKLINKRPTKRRK